MLLILLKRKKISFEKDVNYRIIDVGYIKEKTYFVIKLFVNYKRRTIERTLFFAFSALLLDSNGIKLEIEKRIKKKLKLK